MGRQRSWQLQRESHSGEWPVPSEVVPWSGRLRRGKLHPPQLPAGVVARGRLLEHMATHERPLSLIIAPAGFGKTTLAAQWAASRAPVAWLTIDRRDVSLERFWAHLRVALMETVPTLPALGEVVTAALTIPHRATAVDLGRMLADELLDVAKPVRLVIDDLHLVSSREIFEFLAGLLEIAPPGLQLVATSRSEPPLPLARMRLRGLVTDIRGDALLFTERETRELVKRATPGNRSTSSLDATALHDRTGGWAAGLRLAAMPGPRVVAAVGTHSSSCGMDHQLLTWLLDETLSERPAAEREILLRAAIPERFTLHLLTAMTADLAPAHVVRDAVTFATRSDLCRSSIRFEGDWLEFHPLFRDALRQHLEREKDVVAIREWHARAAQWLEDAGYLDQAITHRIDSGDAATAVAVVLREIRPAFNREDWPAVARWLGKLPAELIKVTPRLLLAQGMVAQLRGQPFSLAEMHIAIERQLARGDLPESEIATLRGEFDSLRINSSNADMIDRPGWLATAQRATRLIDPARRYELGVAWMHLGMALDATGQHQQAIQHLESWIEEAGPRIDAGSIRGFLGLLFVHAQSGNLAASAATAKTTIDLAERHGLRLTAGWGHRFLGDALYELNDLDGAIAHYGSVARDHEYLHLKGLREALFGLALSYLAAGRHDEAWRALRRSREIAIAAGVVHHLPVIEAQEAYLALLDGDHARAARWATVHEPALSSEPFSVLVHPAVIRATILCASAGQADQAAGASSLRDIREQMAYWGYPGALVRVDALLTVAALQRDARDRAVGAMRSSLATAKAHGHLRSYLDLIPMFGAELRELSSSVVFPAPLQHALHDASVPEAAPPRASGALETLTERERDVLGHLVQRLSYNEIGDQLYISPHTVKRHVTSIYSKLDVTGRLEAINAARELGWYAE